MKAINLDRSIAAGLFAAVLALTGTNAIAMTSEHDTEPDDKGAAVEANDTRAVADNVIGGKVGRGSTGNSH